MTHPLSALVVFCSRLDERGQTEVEARGSGFSWIGRIERRGQDIGRGVCRDPVVRKLRSLAADDLVCPRFERDRDHDDHSRSES